MPSLKKQKLDLSTAPQSQQPWETDTQYGYYLDHLNGLNATDIAAKYDLSVGYINDIKCKHQWNRRRDIALGMMAANEQHLTVPDSSLEIEEGQPDDAILSRVVSADEVLSADYIKTAKIHAKLVKSLEEAVANVKTKNLSISELRALASTVRDLQETKHSLAKDILSIEELAAALAEIQKKKRGKK